MPNQGTESPFEKTTTLADKKSAEELAGANV